MKKECLRNVARKTVRLLVFGFVLLGADLPAGAWAQDAMSERYAAIRAPTEALVDRIALRRLQSEFSALARERGRVRGRLRQTEYLRFEDPVSGLAAAEQALNSRLDRIGTDLRDTRGRLADLARDRHEAPVFAPPSSQGLDREPINLQAAPVEFDDRQITESVDTVRAFVEELLRANRARP